MTDQELATELLVTYNAATTRPEADWWVIVARRARALLSAPTLPAEPPEGCVRVRAMVAVYSHGGWSVEGGSMWDQGTLDYRRQCLFAKDARVSFATFDAPKPEPEPAAEIVAVAEPAP